MKFRAVLLRFRGSLRYISRRFRTLKGVLEDFRGGFTRLHWLSGQFYEGFRGYFRSSSRRFRKFQRIYRGFTGSQVNCMRGLVSRFHRGLEGDSMGFKAMRGVSRSFRGLHRLWCHFHGSFRGISEAFCTFKGVSRCCRTFQMVSYDHWGFHRLSEWHVQIQVVSEAFQCVRRFSK